MIKVKEDIHIATVSGFVRPFGVKFIQTGGILVADFGNNSVVRLSKTTMMPGVALQASRAKRPIPAENGNKHGTFATLDNQSDVFSRAS